MKRTAAIIFFFSTWLVLTGCDMFTTASVVPKPEELNNYAEQFKNGDEIEYRMEEMLQPSDRSSSAELVRVASGTHSWKLTKTCISKTTC